MLSDNDKELSTNIELNQLLQKLIIEVTKCINNIRFCSNYHCSCHPESVIKELLKNKELVLFLDNGSKTIVDELRYNCDNYSPIVAEGIYEE